MAFADYTSVVDDEVTPAKLSAEVNALISVVGGFTIGDDGDGTASGGFNLRGPDGITVTERFLCRAWVADAEFSEPDAQTSFTVTTGEQMGDPIEAAADLQIITDNSGAVAVSIDTGIAPDGTKSIWVMVEVNGRVYSSGEIAVTNPS